MQLRDVVMTTCIMPRITVSLSEEQDAQLAELTDDSGPYESKSEAMRSFIGADVRVRELEQEVERLNRERRQLLEQREEHGELVRYAEDQRDQEQRTQQRREKPVWTRVRWWVLGEPSS